MAENEQNVTDGGAASEEQAGGNEATVPSTGDEATASSTGGEVTAGSAGGEVTAGSAGDEATAEGAGGEDAAAVPAEEITYNAVEKDGSVTAIWEMQGRKHLRTIDPRSRQGQEILRLYTAEHAEEQQ